MPHEYTEDEKARIRAMIEAFEGAREYVGLLVRDGSGLCHALMRWSVRGSWGTLEQRRAARADATRLIMRALRDQGYLEDWQRAMGRPTIPRRRSAPLRKRWLDQLIADCKAAL